MISLPDASQQEKPDRSLTVKEVAARLNRCTKWVYENREKMPFAHQLAGSWFFSERGLERFLSGETVPRVSLK